MSYPDYITANLQKRFGWGRQDCVLFVSRWVRIATGRNELHDIEPWRSRRQAITVMAAVGGLENVLDHKFTRISPKLAVDGDIAMHNRCLALFCGREICYPGHKGLMFFDRMEATCAWRCS